MRVWMVNDLILTEINEAAELLSLRPAGRWRWRR